MNKYELLAIYVPTISEKDFHGEVAELRGFLKKNSCKVFFEDVWGMKTLAYRIKKFDQGYYVVLYFDAEPELIREITSSMRLNTRVLRSLLIVLPEHFEAKKHEDTALADAKEASDKAAERAAAKRPRRTSERKFAPDVRHETPAGVSVKPVTETMLKGKTEEEKLKQVEKTLESILENPDIQLK